VKIQLLSDLHLETETFEAEPAPGAELLILGGDIDATWAGYERFAQWPVPVLVVAGNHEFDGRDLVQAWPQFRAMCTRLKLRLLECEEALITDREGRVVRFLGTVRWCDFGVFGDAGRARAERAGSYFQRVMQARRGDAVFDVAAVREEADACRRWLEQALMQAPRGRWQRTVAITHFAPSLKSADPRFGHQPGTASFCNADDDLIPRADLWLHGHLHCRHDYTVARAGQAPTRVVCQARGLVARGEAVGWDGQRLLEV
jgi:predicted phosphodiesterase